MVAYSLASKTPPCPKRAAQPHRILRASPINNLIVDAKMDSHLVLHAQHPDSFLSVGTPSALTTLQGPPQAAAPFDHSAGLNISWFASKDCTFYHAKEEPISPIRQDSDSEETISSSESLHRSPHDNSFGSIARDASFIELYTEVLGALTPQKVCETLCEVTRRDECLGLLRTYVCEGEKVELKARRRLGLNTVYQVTSSGKQVASIKQTAPGRFTILASGVQTTVSLRAKEVNGTTHRLVEVQMPFSHLTSPSPARNSSMPSTRDFLLTLDSKVVFQLGKVARRHFSLRFQRPLDPVLGFALAVCSLAQSNH